LQDLLTDPDAAAQVARARAEYARRRSAGVDALAARGLEVAGTHGINLWLPVADEAAAMVALASEGIRVAAGAPFCVDSGSRAHVRVTVGLVADDHDALAESLARAAGTVAWDAGRP
jgi:DNA-binding transcriptional MocR family regulator